MKFAWIAVAAILILGVGLAMTSSADAKGAPQVTYMWPKDGQVLAQRPTYLRMCFAKPVDVHDLDKDGKFSFGVTPPGGFPLGLRIVFQPDGQGVAIYPGRLPSSISEQGDWKFEWLVRDPASLEEGKGSLTFKVAYGGDEILKDPPDVCPGAGASRTDSAGASVSPTATAAGSARDENNEPDVLKLALLTVGAAGAASVVGLLGYAVRNRVGFWLHRPPERNGDGDEGHH